MTDQERLKHATENTEAWHEGLVAAYEAHQFCTEGGEGRDLTREAKAVLREHRYDGENLDEVAEAIEEEIRESALGVWVRSGWENPGFTLEPAEFQILLTTGGPALRVMGELAEDGTPSRFWVEHQCWGTPWTLWPDVEADPLDWFCSLFYFGE